MQRGPAADRLGGIGTSIFTEITALATQHGAVNLGQGFPDFPAPEFVKEAAARAIRADRNQYAASAGLPRLRQALAADWLRRNPGAAAVSPLDELTPREREILESLASGLSNKEIGEMLFLSEKTVKHYMTNILQKLQVRNRVEAALLAQKEMKKS